MTELSFTIRATNLKVADPILLKADNNTVLGLIKIMLDDVLISHVSGAVCQTKQYLDTIPIPIFGRNMMITKDMIVTITFHKTCDDPTLIITRIDNDGNKEVEFIKPDNHDLIIKI